MAKLRRLVTGHTKDGSAVVASDEMVESFPFPGMPGWNCLDLWSTDQIQHFPDDGARPATENFVAKPGGFRYLIATIDPHTDEKPAGSTDHAVHSTATVDAAYVIFGSCMLELDDGLQVQVNEGESIVQCGTVHAWRNPFDKPCRILFVMIGAKHDALR